ncbi:hypothetical protein [Salinisphaera orenii]|uniref:hypothetical protein n=1 Tax=Salinisphaera orenii TaxID=856731 RepID=UPI0019551064
MASTPRPGVAPEHDTDNKHVVEGEITWLVRVVGAGIGVLLALAIVLGVVTALASSAGPFGAVADGLLVAEIVFAAILIMLGSMVESYGFGLALGTHWPYTKNILLLTLAGDPEAAHRLVATLVGLVAVALCVVDPISQNFVGLGLIVATALFGMGTLYVLAGRAPAFVHGTHGLLAYAVFIVYLVELAHPSTSILGYLGDVDPIRSILFAVFMGGMVTGHRGFGQPIGSFVTPQRPAQWVFVVHGLSALLVIGILGWTMPAYPVAFLLAVIQTAVGFGVFHAVNFKPKAPGTMVAFHQTMALLIATAVIMQW